ncbi:MAG: AbrB/MazE/SpoVT family DNA-binding domain-containing protein [Armatimonadetes bacterium]|nr:AbrB/MazE/SpoVT family DNA-binding domain-containing protein [Armatimonadota bacterium]
MRTIAISPTGRITVAAAMRRKLGWEPGTRLYVLVRDGEIALRRVLRVKDLEGIFADPALLGSLFQGERGRGMRGNAYSGRSKYSRKDGNLGCMTHVRTASPSCRWSCRPCCCR